MQLTRIFKYEGEDIRVVSMCGEPWFVLTDLCGVLDIKNPSDTATRLLPEDLTSVKAISGGQTRELLAVNEPGLYEVIMRSDKPDAVKFRRWVTHDVLPAIAKRGKFVLPEVKAFRKRGRSNMKASEGLFERGDIPSLGFVLEQAAYMYGCSVDEFK